MKVRVPGKLFIAGEYAVLENQPAVVTAVSKYVTVTLEPSDHFYLRLPSLGLNHVTWRYEHHDIKTSIEHPKLNFIKHALRAVCEYLGDNHTLLREPFSILVESELDEATTGKKFGLGSSAAVVTGIVKALLQKAGIHSDERVFKIAAVAHFMGQGSGSGADIAASTFGGLLRYTSFRPAWMSKKLNEGMRIKEIIDEPWPYFTCERLSAPPQLHFCAGWTQSPAGTGSLLQKMDVFKKNHPEVYQTFLQASAQAVSIFVGGLVENNAEAAIKGLRMNRKALVQLGEAAKIPIETDALKRLADIAESFGGAGKPSGAGGGDCGIALLKGEEHIASLYKAWRKAGIEPLPFVH
jgi:phosphomevalonate kinase